MLPAMTCSPPKRLTPSRFDSESRPLRVLPPAFLCAMFQTPGSAADACNLDLRVVLAVTHLLAMMLAATELDDQDLLAALLCDNPAAHLATLHVRSAHGDLLTLA